MVSQLKVNLKPGYLQYTPKYSEKREVKVSINNESKVIPKLRPEAWMASNFLQSSYAL
jgi:hypothetical protein